MLRRFLVPILQDPTSWPPEASQLFLSEHTSDDMYSVRPQAQQKLCATACVAEADGSNDPSASAVEPGIHCRSGWII